MTLLDKLQNQIVIGDGAMGTLLYSYGVDRCFEELNLTNPDDVLHVHKEYIKAGADLIQTNTYGANYIKLSRYGLEEKVKRMNSAAVRLARKAAGKNTFVVGTIGGIHGARFHYELQDELKRSFREQLYCLLLEGVDGLLLETYYDLEELESVLQIAREETDLPIITNVSMHEPGVLENGRQLNEAFLRLEELGADVVGVNCRLGPYHVMKALENIPLPEKAFLSAYPNSGLPEYRDGKLIYKSEPAYFKEFARHFHNEGVRLIGGCCGTTPEHIRAAKQGVHGLVPLEYKKVKEETVIQISEPERSNELTLYEKARRGRSVIVELPAPKYLDTTHYFEGANELREAGADGLTISDNSLASPRICNKTMAYLVKKQAGLSSLVHITCRDRNLIGLQSHLMGLHTLGIRDLLAVTGDPTKIGDFPGATSVFDVTSFDLIKLIKRLNDGYSFSGKSLKAKTSFRVATAFNPNVHNIGKSIERLHKKIEAGADYVLTQPVFSREKLIQIAKETKELDIPIYIGIMPLVSAANAEFLHNEVPGIKLSDEVRNRMAETTTADQAEQVGLNIAKELLDTAVQHFNGIYLITPFIRYNMTAELTRYIKNKSGAVAVQLSPSLR